MIDEKQLQFFKGLRNEMMPDEEFYELLDLARLGLWAKEHGIPTLWMAHECLDSALVNSACKHIQKTMAALPKDAQK